MTDEIAGFHPPAKKAIYVNALKKPFFSVGCIRSFFCMLLLSVSPGIFAETAEKTISIKGENLSLPQIFQLIKKQSDFEFFYNRKLVENLKPVSINVLNASVDQVMDICCKDQPVSYKIVDKIIILEEMKGQHNKGKQLIAMAVPPVTISGTVVNKAGEPLAGVTVTNKNSKAATKTDQNGVFSVTANPADVLQFTYVGYEMAEIKVKAHSETIRIQLAEATKMLEESV